jgi:hypothetical protein
MAIMTVAGATTAATANAVKSTQLSPPAALPLPTAGKRKPQETSCGFRVFISRHPIGSLQRLYQPDHLASLIGIGQCSMHGAEIIGHVSWIGGAGNHCRHARIAQ